MERHSLDRAAARRPRHAASDQKRSRTPLSRESCNYPEPSIADMALNGYRARRANQRFARQVHHKKIFLFPSTPNHPYISRHPVPVEGRWPSSRTLGRDAVDAAVSGAWSCSQGGLWSVSEHSVPTTGANAWRSLSAKTGGCVRQKRVVLAPVAGVKLAEARRPNRV
jgi:hypothetical protein